MYWGYRAPFYQYGGQNYCVRSLLNDGDIGSNWYPKPHIACLIEIDGVIIDINNSFMHRDCSRFSITRNQLYEFTCSKCASIPLKTDFRLRVATIVREDRAIEKRGSQGTKEGRCLGHLSIFELSSHSRERTKKYHQEGMNLGTAKAKIVHLKLKQSTLKESTETTRDSQNLLKFCNNIIHPYRSGVLGVNLPFGTSCTTLLLI